MLLSSEMPILGPITFMMKMVSEPENEKEIKIKDIKQNNAKIC